jgi:AcrR family transcriptional regulator
VIAERGIESTRFADISQAVGVAVSTLQYWFGSREDMLAEAFLHMHRRDVARVEQIAQAEEDPWQRLEHLIRFDLGQAPERPSVDRRGWLEFWRAALRDEEIRAESERVYDWWRRPFLDAIRDGVERRMFTPVAAPEAIVTDIMTALDGATVPLLLRHHYFDPVAFADDLLTQLGASLRYSPAATRST